jgi:UDP-N-acetylmuramoylalanine--D-glutamate ligase
MGIQPEHQVVMELSSFQLELMFTSPQIAAVLNITPNHLDRHKTMENYLRAKSHIIAFQGAGGVAVLGRDDPGSRSLETLAKGEIAWFSRREMVPDGAFMAGDRLVVTGISSPDGEPHVVCEESEIPLRGEHNVYNVLAACAITGAAGIPPEIMTEVIKDFKPVPHRLETVRVVDGVTRGRTPTQVPVSTTPDGHTVPAFRPTTCAFASPLASSTCPDPPDAGPTRPAR